MKRENGVTLITLVITIIIIFILAGIGISVGVDSIGKAETMRFNTELKIIHTRVNELIEEMNISEIEEMLEEAGYDYSIPNSKAEQVSIALDGQSSDGFWYFNKTGLEIIGVSGIDREVIINFDTREVVDINGIDDNGTMIYRASDWYNMSYSNRNTEAPTFTLSKEVYGLNATIFIDNIEFYGNVSRGTLSYCLLSGATEGTWHQVSGTEIPVSVMGTYKVRLTDSAGNIAEQTIEIALANKPKLESGMTPVTLDSSHNATTVDENSGTWYDYSDASKWAYAKNENDEILVWIPRCMYNVSENNEENVDIKFLKGTTNIATDNTNEQISNSGEAGTWNIHRVFRKDITGIWALYPEEGETVVALLDTAPKTIPEAIEEGLAKGNTINWIPSGTYTQWKAEYYSDDDTVDKVLYSGADAITAGATTSTNWSDATTAIDMTISSWKVLDVDIINNTVKLVPAAPTTSGVKLKGAQGYNNSVKLLNDACDALYGGTAGSSDGITARSISMVDLEGTAGDGSNGLMSADTSKVSAEKGVGFPVQASSAYIARYSKYPKIYEEEALRDINGTYSADGIGMSSEATTNLDTNGFIPGSIYGVTDATSIQPSQTYYTLDNSKFSSALGTINEGLILQSGSSTRNYWVASRCILLWEDYSCYFMVRLVTTGRSGKLGGNNMFNSGGSTYDGTFRLFPVVTLSAGTLTRHKRNIYIYTSKQIEIKISEARGMEPLQDY